MIFFISITTALIIFAAVAAYIVSRKILNPPARDYAESYRLEIKEGDMDTKWFDSLGKEDVHIESEEGLRLHGLWIRAKDSTKTIILSHGYSSNLYSSVKYMDMFIKRRFNVLLIDHRYYGLSEGKICTMGHREKNDLIRWVSWVEDRVGRDTTIGTHGVSMGGSTALLHGAIDDRVDFIIADCPFMSLLSLLRHRLKQEYKLPPFPLLYLSDLASKIRCGLFYSDVSPLKIMRKIKVPILFIHGKFDNYIPSSHSVKLHMAIGGNGFLYLVPGAEHCESYTTDRENYTKVVNRFLDNCSV